MIPKKIHYCWFGPNEIPEKEQKCIATWKEFFPDYEIKLWNEDNFNYEACDYARQAHDAGQYAFVSDYARAKVLFEEGGIYFDTDLEVIKPFPEIQGENGYMGFERRARLGTYVLASAPKTDVMRELLAYYEDNQFFLDGGMRDTIANVSILTDIMVKRGLTLVGQKHQMIDGYEIFGRETFYSTDKRENIPEETCAVHVFSNSWLTEREKKRGKNIVWRKVARPFLRQMRKLSIKISGEDKTREKENKLRNKLK